MPGLNWMLFMTMWLTSEAEGPPVGPTMLLHCGGNRKNQVGVLKIDCSLLGADKTCLLYKTIV